MNSLLQAIAAEGGPIQQLAEQIAVNGLLASDGLPTDQDAASVPPPSGGSAQLLPAAPSHSSSRSPEGGARERSLRTYTARVGGHYPTLSGLGTPDITKRGLTTNVTVTRSKTARRYT